MSQEARWGKSIPRQREKLVRCFVGGKVSGVTEEHCALQWSKQEGSTRRQAATMRSQMIVHRTL